MDYHVGEIFYVMLFSLIFAPSWIVCLFEWIISCLRRSEINRIAINQFSFLYNNLYLGMKRLKMKNIVLQLNMTIYEANNFCWITFTFLCYLTFLNKYIKDPNVVINMKIPRITSTGFSFQLSIYLDDGKYTVNSIP